MTPEGDGPDARDRTLEESLAPESPISEGLILDDSSVDESSMVYSQPDSHDTSSLSSPANATVTVMPLIHPQHHQHYPHPTLPVLSPRLLMARTHVHVPELLRRDRTKDSFQGSLESIDSLIESYWDPDDVESTITPITGNVAHPVDFFTEHVHFLRIQTQPRQVEVVWTKTQSQEQDTLDESVESVE
jgi:hypothetical protein